MGCSPSSNEFAKSKRLGAVDRMNICWSKSSTACDMSASSSGGDGERNSKSSLKSADNAKEQKNNPSEETGKDKVDVKASSNCFAKEKDPGARKDHPESAGKDAEMQDNLGVTFESEVFGKKPVIKKEAEVDNKEAEELEVLANKLQF